MSFFSYFRKKDYEKNNYSKSIQYLFFINKIISICYLFIFLALIFLISFISNNSLSQFFTISNKYIFKMKLFLIILFVLLFLFSFLLCCSLIIGSYSDFYHFRLQYIFLSFFTFNILTFISIIIFSCKISKNTEIEHNSNFKAKLGIKPWRTRDYTLIALFTALTIVLAYIEQYFLPNLPNGGSFAPKYIVLIVISFIHSTLAGFITGAISALLSLIFIQSYIVSPWSYMLDYFLPMITPCIAGLMRFTVNKKNNYIAYVNYIIMCFSIYFIIWIWQVLVGYFVWNTLFPDSIWEGYPGWLYVIVYDFISVFILTYPISQILIPIILRSLAPYFWANWGE